MKLAYPAALLLLPALLVGCSDSLMGAADMAPTAALEATGETLLFVGTDPTTLNTELYLVRAVSSAADNPSIAGADSYELERLTDLGSAEPEGLLVSEADRLFSDSLPYPIPDELGNRIALLATDSSASPEQASGRIAVIDLLTRATTISNDVVGLQGVRFTQTGDWLILEQVIEGGAQRLLLLPADDLQADLLEVAIPDPQLSQEFAGVISGSNDFLVLARNEDAGTSSVYRVEAETGTAALLTGELQGLLTGPTLNADGTVLALTLTDIWADKRSIVVVDEAGQPSRVTDNLDADCYWPTWSPATDAKQGDLLAFVCQDLVSSRPDIGIWDSSSLSSSESLNDTDDTVGCGTDGAAPCGPVDFGADLLTDVSQPAIFEGTMDGLVIRSRPQWEPLGQSVIFGVSTAAEAYAGEGMSLLALPIGGTAYPIYSGAGTSADWAHFSGSSQGRTLLLWERSETGLDDTDNSILNAQPIRVIGIEQANPEPTYVSLGRDLLVSYPMFLGQNTLFYR